MMNNGYIPNQQPMMGNGMNPMQLMQEYQKFKQEYYAKNQNPDPKTAVMQQISGNMNNPAFQQAMQFAHMMGFK